MNDIKKDTNTNQVLIIKFNIVSLLIYKHIFYNFLSNWQIIIGMFSVSFKVIITTKPIIYYE